VRQREKQKGMESFIKPFELLLISVKMKLKQKDLESAIRCGKEVSRVWK
jgi:hypothetical protein